MLIAPESVSRRCAQLQGSRADLALSPRPAGEHLALWMQTTGAALLGIEQRSVVRLWVFAQDGRSAPGLLYLAAVRDDWREQERCQGRVDIPLVSLTAPEAAGVTAVGIVIHGRSVCQRLATFRGAIHRWPDSEQDVNLLAASCVT